MFEDSSNQLFLVMLAIVCMGISAFCVQDGMKFGCELNIDMLAGSQLRQLFNILLMLSSILRAFLLISEIIFLNNSFCQDNITICLLVRYTPDFIFISIYCVIILHWISANYTFSKSFLLASVILVGLGNFILYSLAIIILAVAPYNFQPTLLFTLLCLPLFTLLGCFLCFGALLLKRISRNRFSFSAKIRVRIITICAVISTLISMQLFYFICVINSPVIVNWPLGYPPNWMFGFDSLKVSIFEVMPSILFIILMWRGLAYYRSIRDQHHQTNVNVGTNSIQIDHARYSPVASAHLEPQHQLGYQNI